MDYHNVASIETEFCCSSCNRTPNSVHWGLDGYIIYAASYGILIVDPNNNQGISVIASKACHDDKINCVRWIRSASINSLKFLTGSVDKTLKLWSFQPNGRKVGLELCYADAESAIICCDGLEREDGSYLIAAGSADSYLRIYHTVQDSQKAIQSIKCGSGFVLSLHLGHLHNVSTPILAYGGDDMKVHLLVWQKSLFEEMIVLSGHEDWIRGIQLCTDDKGDVLLASCSQDCFVRVWRIHKSCSDKVDEEPSVESELKLKDKLIKVLENGQLDVYGVTIETVLYGHEGWVYGLQWHPPIYDVFGSKQQPMRLLTASMDKTMILWEPDPDTGVWEEKLRVGEVGGNTLGLFGCNFSPDGKTILAHGYQGAFTIWKKADSEGSQWQSRAVVGGHFGDVTDLVWDPAGEFLMTTSADQTSRLFAPWKGGRWYEMGRPQVHGYDIQCIAMINRFSFASGADEKVIRTFSAPLNVLENLQRLLRIDLTSEISDFKKAGANYVEGASVPALGLSNKAVYYDKAADLYADRELIVSENEQYKESAFRPLELHEPPSEDNLFQNTLWPETHKLYGHGFEVHSIAVNPQGTVLASACKATKTEHASIMIWSIPEWQQIRTLEYHTLTVVQMEFSHSGDRLLSVSRDRTWAIHHFNYTTGDIELVAGTDKDTALHSRIIWSCSWSHDDLMFVTGSRDKKIIIWSRSDEKGTLSSTEKYSTCSQYTFNEPVTAVSFAPIADQQGRYLVAAGLENGEINICCMDRSFQLLIIKSLDISLAHHLCVRRLRFRPHMGQAGVKADEKQSSILQLASCGQDQLVKVYNLYF